MGALWGTIGLLPVIGLVQVGAQSHAERYAYLPMVGVIVAVTWWAGDLARRWDRARRVVGPLAVVVLLLLATATRGELRYWRDEIALFRRAIALHERSGIETPHAMILYYQLGTALQREGRLEEAVEAYRSALEANPDDPRPHNNLGASLAALGRDDEAAAQFEAALEVEPRHPAALYNLALREAARGDTARARSLFVRFLEAGHADRGARERAIRSLIELGAPEPAAAAALRTAPPDADLLTIAAEGLRQTGRDVEARGVLERALQLVPGDRVLRNNLAWLLATSDHPGVRDPARAVELMRRLESEAPLDADERDTLERALASLEAPPSLR
jgi:Flp pilus assembly protein TadD